MTTPGNIQSPEGKGTVCPSCHRFVGVYDRCPYCGTGITKRIPLRTIRIAALVIAGAGMICLHIMAMYRDIPAKPIGEITPAMNFGYVSVKGRVNQPLRFYRDGDTISGVGFGVEDATGQLRVRAYRKVAETLYENGLVLRRGDTVKVAGTLRVVEGDNISMLLQVPAHLEVLETSDAQTVSLDELAEVEDDRSVRFSAAVSRIMFPNSERAPYRIALKDDTGTGSLVIWPNQFEEIKDRDQLMEGTLVKIRAAKSSYRNIPQLQIESPQDLVILAAVSADSMRDAAAGTVSTPVSLRDISSADMDSIVTVQAVVKQFSRPREGTRAPYVITLADSSGTELPLVFWSDAYEQLKSPDKIEPGAELTAHARVAEYRGRLQLALTDPAGLVVKKESAGTTGRQETEKEIKTIPDNKTDEISGTTQAGHREMPLARALKSPDGTKVTVTGIVERVIPSTSGSSAPNRVILKSEAGPVTVVCWEEAWSHIPEASRPVPGAEIQVSAAMATYRGNKQLRLLHSDNYALLTPGRSQGQSPGTMPLKDIGIAKLGLKVIVEGTVETISHPTSSRRPYTISITDGTTSVPVVMWEETWKSLTEKPVTGSTFRIRGTVNEYMGARQIRVSSGTFSGPSTGASRQRGGQASILPLSAVETTEPGTRITIQGEVSDVDKPSNDRAPYRITLKDGTDTVTMVLWKDTWEGLSAYARPQNGATLIVTGTVSEYKDTRQIRVDSTGNIERIK
jgi:DNA/RNA endonuclease YhcR with UshA esterase domain